MLKASIRLVVATTILLSTGAVAGPCDNPKRATYLSNVCWLVGELGGWKTKVLAADQGNCTVQLEEHWRKRVPKVARPHPDDPLHWGYEDRRTKFTIYFNRANVRASKIRANRSLTCLTLVGEGVTDHPRYDWMRDKFQICLAREKDRVVRAVHNLYGVYCSGTKTEF